jgi:hypothetical protein
MITALPYSTAEIIGSVAPRKVTGPGIVEMRLDEGVYVISLASGKMTVKVSSGSLSEGDPVNVTQRGNELVLQKTGAPEQSGAPALKDAVEVNSNADPNTLRTIVDTVVDQLKKRILDKPTLDQLQRILAAVSKTPEAFDTDTQKAIRELKSIVCSVPADGHDISQVAAKITDRLIALGEKLGQQLKNAGGAVDIILKPEANLNEGYYKFDSIKTALSWISENKEISADIPWRKLSSVFKDGPVVLKAYESAIGDTRASLIAPDKVNTDIEHFVQSNLKADIWKNFPGSVLVNLLSDRKEIPLDRLLQIDKLLSEYGGVRAGTGTQIPRDGALPENKPLPAPKGLETAFGQWLAIALDKDSPVEALAARAPAPGPAGLIGLLRNIDASHQNAAFASPEPLENEHAALSRLTVMDAQRPEAVVIDAFRRLGLDLESALLKSQSTASPDALQQNLKTRLLSLQSALDSAASETEPPDAQKVSIDGKAVLSDIAARLDALAQSLKGGSEKAMEQSSENVPQPADTIKNLIDLVKEFARQTAAGGEPADRTTGQTKQQAEIELLAKNISSQLEGLVKSLSEPGAPVGQAYREIAKQLGDLAAQTVKLADKIPQEVDRGPLDTIKQQVEQALTRVESMQVLAKQISFADNQQQVMSLPMKIDGQWTDVVVKFMKRKGPSEKELSRKNVSVVIHVAPTLLGEVTVFMDYNGKRDFSMRMEFEKASSRQWFEDNRTEFSKAVGKFGFTSFKIDMNTGRDNPAIAPAIEAALPTAGTIDIKA